MCIFLRTGTCDLDEATILKQWSADKSVAQWKKGVHLASPAHSIEQFYLNKTLSKDVDPKEVCIKLLEVPTQANTEKVKVNDAHIQHSIPRLNSITVLHRDCPFTRFHFSTELSTSFSIWMFV